MSEIIWVVLLSFIYTNNSYNHLLTDTTNKTHTDCLKTLVDTIIEYELPESQAAKDRITTVQFTCYNAKEMTL